MSFGDPWGTPFYSGGGSSALVPSLFHLGIAGHAYMLDTEDGPPWVTDDIPVQRAQADTNADPSEATLNTEGLWRRTRLSGHLGTGQDWADRPESSPFRFADSLGVDPWTRDRWTLLNDTTLSLATSAALPRLAVVPGRVYVTDGQVVRYTTDLVNWTAITGNPAATALSIATDGVTVYIAYGASGLYSIASGAGAMAVHSTGTVAAVGYAKGRLLVAETSTGIWRVYNVTASGGAVTAGTLVLTLPSGGTIEPGQWTAEGPGAVYIAAQVGDKSRIWRTAVQKDGTALDVAVVAGELPDGQFVRSIQGYLGLMLAGTTDRMWVLGLANTAGDLEIRGNFPLALPCFAFEPQDRFVWHGGADVALGRMDLSANTAANASDFVPARANDLAAALSGHTYSIATYLGVRVFTVASRGVYVEQEATPVASGYVDFGVIGFGIGDPKNGLFADVRHSALAAGDSVSVEAAKDGGAFSVVGASDTVGTVSATVALGQLLAETIRVRVTLAGDVALTMLTARAVPAPKVGEVTRLRLLLWRKVKDLGGNDQVVDVPREVAFLKGLRSGRTVVTVQLGAERFSGIVDRLARFTAQRPAPGPDGGWLGWWQGSLELDIKRVEA